MDTVVHLPQDIVTYISDTYEYLFSLADSRPKDWFLVNSLRNVIFCNLFYVLVIWVGPKLMKNRQPFKLTSLLIFYNFGMALLNVYITYEVVFRAIKLKYNVFCQPHRETDLPDELQLVEAVWWCMFSKLLEFCDTFFFVLRKKERQLTFLHMYHHITIFSLAWVSAKWIPSSSIFFPIAVNSFIHVVMYTYYGLAAFGPKMAKFLWWKKYLTILQLAQFVILLVMGVNGTIRGCNFPMWMHYGGAMYMLSFIVLFGNFYRKAYIEKGKTMFFGMDVGCGQGDTYVTKNDSPSTNNHEFVSKNKTL